MWHVHHGSPRAGRGMSNIIRLGLLFSCLVLGLPTSVNGVTTTGSTDNAPSTIPFSSAVLLASSISWRQTQLTTSSPVLPLPTNISSIPQYEIVSRLAPALPPIQAGVSLGRGDNMNAGITPSMNVSTSGASLVDRQSALRVMVVGDSMSHGREGDYTWRYRIWQFFQQNGVDVEMVGPYHGTMPPDAAAPPSPPPLYGAPAPPDSPRTTGGYASDVDSAFLSNCRAVAVDKGLIQGVLQSTPADLILYMLGFNDMGWFYSDAVGTIDSANDFVTNARAANPNIKIAMANVPQRSFIGGREDLVQNTQVYNKLLADYIPQWSTAQSPIHLVHLEENYDCQPGGCPAGSDGLHPNAWGEFQIANAFSQTLVNDFGLGKTPIAVPAQDDPSLVRALPQPSNIQVFSSPQGVTATWDKVYGAYSYDVTVSINGGGNTFSPTTVSSNRWDSQWPLEGWTYAVSVRARCGDHLAGPYTATLSAKATPELPDPPQNVKVEPTADGFIVTWDPPTGAHTGTIVEYNVIYWDWYYTNCQFLSGAAFTSSPAVITGLTPGRNYLIAPVAWNQNGQGWPVFANNAVPGAGAPPVPTDLEIISNDPTTVHITWTGSASAGGYHLWVRNVNEEGSVFRIAANITESPCDDIGLLIPGTWNYEWCVSAFNGNEESEKGPAKLAPSPASTVTQGSPGPSCEPAPSWCPAGGHFSIPPGHGTLPPLTGVQTITTDGKTLTITPVATPTVQTLTQPDGSTVVLTIPSGSSAITGLVTITTDGSTLTVGPIPTSDPSPTSTMTTVPAGVSLQDFTDYPITTNIWLTTTGSDSSTTIVPVILPCRTCEPVIVWDVPEIQRVVFKWPKFPELPSFHLPCIKIFGLRISGECPSPSGPPPVIDGPPPEPRPSGDPEPDPEDDPCQFKTSTGMCDNGNYPVFDSSSGTIKCDVPSSEVDSKISQCQRNIDNNLGAAKSYVEGEQSCCPTSNKARRQDSEGTLSSLIHRGLDSLGLGMRRRADYCPAANQNPKAPPAGQCYATYTCPHALYPNVCGNAKSAIQVRGATSILTHNVGSGLHVTDPWYEGHYVNRKPKNKPQDIPKGGWKLDKCEVEEYPFGSGNPDRSPNAQSVLRLIPGGAWQLKLENQNHGRQLREWVTSVKNRYNDFQKQQTGRNPNIEATGIVYCVDFDPSFTKFLPEDQVNENYCASIYGVEFTLVKGDVEDAVRTWDPWFDVPNTNRKKPELLKYVDPDGKDVQGPPTENDYALYGMLPPSYCRYPSPGKQDRDLATNTWSLAPGYQALPRMDNDPVKEKCTDPPGQHGSSRARRDGVANQTHTVDTGTTSQARTHARDLVGRADSPGGFLDANIYKFLGCGDDESDTADGDPCAADDSSCGGENLEDAVPGPAEGGVSTSHLSKTTKPPTTPASSSAAPSISPYVMVIWLEEFVTTTSDTDTWYWDCQLFDRAAIVTANICDQNAHPLVYSTPLAGPPAGYPTSLGTFSLHGHSKCSYQGPNTAAVGSVVCDDGLTATCKPDIATSAINCGQEGVAGDWFSVRATCGYH